ncbi:MAG: hypothetical protein CM15mP109_08900 [Candidatus Dadabacteria bacterium]|nr:MAG: hypothetical protein CM15mP109_08900 [Candidatus Dadabacteria bacterium]
MHGCLENYIKYKKNFGLDGDNVDHYYTDPENRYSVVGSNP